MTRKQERFIEEYVKCRIGTIAARNAGYSSRTAHVASSRMLSQDKFKDIIEAKIKAIDASLSIDQKRIRTALLKEAETSEKASDRIAAWRLLGLDQGMFKENTQVAVGYFTQAAENKEVTKPL